MTTFLLACGAVGAVSFVVVFTVDGLTRRAYRPVYHPVSALSLGERGWLQVANFVVTGTLTVGAAVGAGLVLAPDVAGLLGAALLGVFGVALVASGVFPMDAMRGYPPGTPAGTPARTSTTHDVHDAAGVVVFGALPAACLALAWAFASGAGSDGLAAYSFVTGAALIVLFIAFGSSWERDGARSGLIQRVMIVVGWSWVALTCVELA